MGGAGGQRSGQTETTDPSGTFGPGGPVATQPLFRFAYLFVCHVRRFFYFD